MPVLEKLNIGLVGAGGRGGSFREALESNGARIHAVCDLRKEALTECANAMKASETYSDYGEMIERSDLDAVIIGTPMQLHVPQSVRALRRNIHVMSEVPAGVSIPECRRLVAACRKSRAVYMMAENYTYMRNNVAVRELARERVFGQVYYAEGEYIHELKELNEITRWRRKWQTGINGVTYGTHSLGPILQCMPGDRVARVCCAGSGHHYRDARGKKYENEDSCVMLCKTVAGALIKIRVDMLSDRPHAMTNYQIQGTDGAYESARNGPGDLSKLWLRALSKEPRWFVLKDLLSRDTVVRRRMPLLWRKPPPEASRAGHGGGDYYEVRDFIMAIQGKAPCAIGIHEAMDMTLPGLVSQRSIRKNGAWLDVPDSRDWK